MHQIVPFQGNQDGGPNAFGTVIEMKRWKGEPSRLKFGVRVVWDNGEANMYRWGAEDAWDVQVVGGAAEPADIEVRLLQGTCLVSYASMTVN